MTWQSRAPAAAKAWVMCAGADSAALASLAYWMPKEAITTRVTLGAWRAANDG